MTDVAELVERLRGVAEYGLAMSPTRTSVARSLLLEAADTLEAMSKQQDPWRVDL